MSRMGLTVKDTEVKLCYPPVGCVSHSVKAVQLLLALDEMRGVRTAVIWLEHRSLSMHRTERDNRVGVREGGGPISFLTKSTPE